MPFMPKKRIDPMIQAELDELQKSLSKSQATKSADSSELSIIGVSIPIVSKTREKVLSVPKTNEEYPAVPKTIEKNPEFSKIKEEAPVIPSTPRLSKPAKPQAPPGGIKKIIVLKVPKNRSSPRASEKPVPSDLPNALGIPDSNGSEATSAKGADDAEKADETEDATAYENPNIAVVPSSTKNPVTLKIRKSAKEAVSLSASSGNAGASEKSGASENSGDSEYASPSQSQSSYVSYPEFPETLNEPTDDELPSPASNPNPKVIVSASNVFVKFPSKIALDNVSFEIYEGEIFALLGTNGAGKSTILSCLCRQKTDYEGSLLVNGREVKEDRENVISTVALVPQEYSFFFDFTVNENLEFAARMYGLPGNVRKKAIDTMIEEYHLGKFVNVRARNLSGGYKRLLNIAMSVIKDPKLVLLDEPTAGLDVSMRKLINEAIKRFKRKGVSVVLTTHYLEDVEAVADRVMMLSLGKLLSIGTLSELIAKNGGPYTIILSDISGDVEKLTSIIMRFKSFEKIVPLQNTIYLIASQEKIGDCLAELSGVFASNKFQINKIDIKEPSLNRAFLGIAGH